MTEPITVTIDQTPHRYLAPNSGKHKRTKDPYRQELKHAAAIAAGNVLRGRTWAFDGPVTLYITIVWEQGHQVIDFDNAIASCKAAIDGVFAKLDADDRQVVGIYLRQYRSRERHGHMVVTVVPETGEGANPWQRVEEVQAA